MNKAQLKEIYLNGQYLEIIDHYVKNDPNIYVLLIREKYLEEISSLKSRYQAQEADTGEDTMEFLVKNKIEPEKTKELKRFLIELSNDNIILLEIIVKDLGKKQYFFQSREKLALWLMNNSPAREA